MIYSKQLLQIFIFQEMDQSLSIESTVGLRSRARMPLLGLGTYLQDSEKAKVSVRAALSAGYRSIDTAEYYDNHDGIGIAIIESGIPRSEIFITDKVSPGGIFGAPARTFEEIIETCKLSLARIQTSYFDLYLLHHGMAGPDARLSQYRALLELQKLGLVKDIGVSNFSESHIREIADAGLPLPSVNQIEIHPLCTQSHLIQYLRTNNIIPVAYSSLAPLSTWRVEVNQASGKTATDTGHAALMEEIAKKYGVSSAQLLLRWALQHGYPILPKSDSSHRILHNATLYSFSLDVDDLSSLDGLDQNKCFAWPVGNPLDSP